MDSEGRAASSMLHPTGLRKTRRFNVYQTKDCCSEQDVLLISDHPPLLLTQRFRPHFHPWRAKTPWQPAVNSNRKISILMVPPKHKMVYQVRVMN